MIYEKQAGEKSIALLRSSDMVSGPRSEGRPAKDILLLTFSASENRSETLKSFRNSRRRIIKFQNKWYGSQN